MAIIRTALGGDDHVNCPGRKEEARRVKEWQLQDWKQRGVHFIGLAGDWNEVPPDEQDQAWSRDFLGRCAEVAPVALIYGNHDPAGCLDEFHMQTEHRHPITVVSQPDVITVNTEAGQIAVACVPFVWKAHLLAQIGPVSPEESDRLVQIALSDIYRGLGVKVRELDLPTIALIHGKWRGSKLNEEQPNRPLGMDMPLEDIEMIGADFIDCAHIHLAQDTLCGSAPICTPSSPYFVDYGESRHEKGYLWIEIDTDIVPAEPGSQVKWQRVPTPVAPMILLEYKWEGGMFARVSDGEEIHESHVDPEGADIRFRFHYPKESSVQAKSAAAEIEASLFARGAVKVKLDPVVIPTQSTRSLEIVKASTLGEQARLLWKKWELKLTEDEERILNERIEEIQAECGFGQRLTLDAGIHVKSTRMKGWRCFPDEVSLKFDEIEGQVIAISGPNGVGKSLGFEVMIPGAIFRDLPTHGNIGDHAIARDTFVETNFEYAGKDYTVSQIIDGKDGSGSSSLKIGVTPVFGTETALRTQYDKWAAENLPPISLVTSTTFMPQESKGILGMGATARKSLILKAKGVERYEVLAEAGRKRSTDLSKELGNARTRIEEIGETNIDTLKASAESAQVGKAEAEAVASFAERTLAEAREEKADVDKRRADHALLESRLVELSTQVTAMRTKRTQVETKIEVGKALTGRKAEIEKAVADVATLEAEIAALPTNALQVELTKAQARELHISGDKASLEKRIDELQAQDEQLTKRLASLQTQADEARAVLGDEHAIRKAVAETAELQTSLKAKWEEDHAQRVREAQLAGELRDIRTRWNANAEAATELQQKINDAIMVLGPEDRRKTEALAAVDLVAKLEADIQREETKRAQYWTEIEALQTTISKSKDNQIQNFQTPLEAIAKRAVDDPAQTAGEALEKNEEIVAEAEDAPLKLAEFKRIWQDIGDDLLGIRSTLALHREVAATLPELEAAERTLAESRTAFEAANAAQAALTEESNEIVAQQEELVPQMRQTQSDIRWLDEQIQQLTPLVARAEILATADTKLQSLAEQTAVIVEDRNTITVRISAAEKGLAELQMTAEDAALKTNSLQTLSAANNATIAQLRSEIEDLSPLASQSQLLTAALAAEETLLHQLSQIDEELETLEHNHDQLEHQVDEGAKTLPEPIDLTKRETTVTRAREALQTTQTLLVVAEKELRDAEAKEERRLTLIAETKRLEKEVDRWNLVERTVGRDGLIAESVAAAGDEINERANQLLRASGNTKYTVDLKTTKMTKDGKKEIEGCPIFVSNSETGETQEGSTLSPGQRAFVNLPISLTLAEIGCKDSTVKPTIYMDEPTAGLDPIMRIQFVAMMRDVAENLDAQIFFVTHNEELMALADARIAIVSGKISVS